MQTYNEALLDAMIRHQIGLLRYSGSVRNRIWRLLDATESDIKAQIRRRGGDAGFASSKQVKALDQLLKGLRKTRVGAWKQATSLWMEEMHALALAEPGFFDRTLTASIPGIELGTVLPDPADLNRIVTSKPFMGKTMRAWASNVRAADIGRIEDQIKIGLTQGESIPALSRRIVGSAKLKGRDGVTQITRRNAAAITRTVTNGIASEARKSFASMNADLIPFEVFTATLDSRTTPICRRYDGKRYRIGEGPQLPLHMGERSLYSPSIDGDVVGSRPRRDFTQRSLLRDFAKREGFGAPKTRAALPRGTKRDFDAFARKRMRELTGRTAASTTYGQWLGRQSAAIQNDILGPTRGALFRRGDLKIEKFVEASGRELTLAELANQYTDSFLQAGLDPALFQ